MKSFKNKVQSMTAKEIIMAMVEGLRNPAVEINMNSFGHSSGGVCYGCAATNTICKIADIKLTPSNIWTIEERAVAASHIDYADRGDKEALFEEKVFLDAFENAIDSLRQGWIDRYNDLAREFKFAVIKNYLKLPVLTGRFTEEDLKAYEQLANEQE